MRRTFKSSRDYFSEVERLNSDELGWTAVRLTSTSEQSNDVVFANVHSSTLTLDLSGTSRHYTKMDGIVDLAPTRPGDVCIVPAGLEARFAWQISGQEQNSLMVEFDHRLFADYCPEV